MGGVVLNIKGEQHLALEFDRMMQIPEAHAIMVQPMLKGTELFIGAKYEEKFGHVVLCGLGGIFVEVLKDVSSGLAPLSYEEAYSMIHSLRAYKIIQGTRGQKGVNEDKFAEIIGPSFHPATFCHGDQGDGYQSAIGYGERGDSGGCADKNRKRKMKRGENSPFFSPSPILPVQIPIADGFGQVSGEYLFATFQIGNGARYF